MRQELGLDEVSSTLQALRLRGRRDQSLPGALARAISAELEVI